MPITAPPSMTTTRAHAAALPEQARASSTGAPATSTEVRNTNTTRLQGTFDADVLHDVLVEAGASVTGLTRDVQLGTPQLLSSEVTHGEDGKVVVENRIEIPLVITTREELRAFADLLGQVRVEDGTLAMAPVTSRDETVTVTDGETTRTVTDVSEVSAPSAPSEASS